MRISEIAEIMDMDDKSIANMAVLAGEIMLRSGAETYRVEDTIKHILDTACTAGGSASRTGRSADTDAVRTESLTGCRYINRDEIVVLEDLDAFNGCFLWQFCQIVGCFHSCSKPPLN